MEHSFILRYRHCSTILKFLNNLHLCDMTSSSVQFFADSDRSTSKHVHHNKMMQLLSALPKVQVL